MQKYRINVGCGRSPTAGWINLDNSFALKLARFPSLVGVLKSAGMLKPSQIKNIEFSRENKIGFCDARIRIPVPDGSADVVYASHMMEHLDRSEAARFLTESRRVLCPGGTLRLALPNLSWHINNYAASGSADEFMEKTKLGRILPKTFLARAKVFCFGEREYHLWMYDESSAVRTLAEAGFVRVRTYPPGQTRIENAAPLDLFERAPESLFVEGTRA